MTLLAKLLEDYGFYVCLPLTLLLVIAWIYRPSAKRRYQADGAIPFNEGNEGSEHNEGTEHNEHNAAGQNPKGKP